MVDRSGTGRSKRILRKTLTRWRTFGDKSTFLDSVKRGARVKVVCQVDSHISGQYPWFIGQDRYKDRYEFSISAFWRPVVWSC